MQNLDLVLVTGGLGYIACHVVYKLILSGMYKIWIVNDDEDEEKDWIETKQRLQLLKDLANQFDVILYTSNSSICNIDEKLLRKVSVVVHLSACPQNIFKNDNHCTSILDHVTNTLLFFQKLVHNNVRNIIHTIKKTNDEVNLSNTILDSILQTLKTPRINFICL